MEWTSKSTVQFKPLDQSNAQGKTGSRAEAHISIGLETFDALNGNNPSASLVEEKDALRKTIFRAAVEQIVPDLVHSTGASIEPPSGQSDVTSEYTSHQQDSVQVRDDILMTRHDLEMAFQFYSEQIMNPATLLYLGREGVASAITDQVIHSLEQRYEGKEHSNVTSDSSLVNGEVTQYQAQTN